MVVGAAAAGAAGAEPQEKLGLSIVGGGAPRLLFPEDQTFWFEIARCFSTIAYGGAEFGEVMTIASQIKAGDFEGWYTAFNAAADRLAAEAEAQLAKGHRVTARDIYLRASTYYFTSEFFLHGNPADPRIARAYKMSSGTYVKAAALHDVPILPVEIPYEGKTIPGYFHRPAGPAKARKTLIMHTGFDGSAEEMHFSGARAAVERGYNVLAIDGPGQYGAVHRDGLLLRPDWEKVITPTVDFLVKRPEVDPRRIAYMGISLGGVLAPRAAAFEPRLAALVANDGIYDFGSLVNNFLPPECRQELAPQVTAASAPELDQMLNGLVNGTRSERWVFHHGMWITGSRTPREFFRKMLDYNVKDGVAERIKCPTLVLSPDGDMALKGQPEALFEHLRCKDKTLMRFTAAEGAGLHCQLGAIRLSSGRILDWLDERLNS